MKSALNAEHFQTEEAAFAYVEAKLWPDGPVCPHCGVIGEAGRLQGKSTRPGLWKCYACRKPFTVRMRSVFESSHVPLRVWLQAIYLMCSSKKGISTRQLQRTFGCGLKTAWFLSHRIRECMKEGRDMFTPPIGGAGHTVEVDETYVGRKAGSRAFEPPAKKQAVMALVQRGGKVRSFHVPNVTANNLRPIIGRHIHQDSRFISDEAATYTMIGWNFASSDFVTHSAKEYVRGDVYTNTVEGYFSILKRGIYGVYQHVSEAHLQRYLHEFDFRYSNRVKLGIDDLQRADIALIGAKGKRLTYRTVGRARAT
jgi:transposase-like protein